MCFSLSLFLSVCLSPSLSPSLSLSLSHARARTHREELTFPYSHSPSRARLLTSFGFDAAPSASLMASDVPQRDANWLAERGCSGDALRRIELHLVKDPSSGAKLGLTERGVREALRCIRLQVFTSEEAELAISEQHYFEMRGYLRRCSYLVSRKLCY